MKKFLILATSVFMLSCTNESDKAYAEYESAINAFVNAAKSNDETALNDALVAGEKADEHVRSVMANMDSVTKADFKRKIDSLDAIALKIQK